MEVSVIIPTFNGRHKLSNVIESLKQQTFKDFEIIIVIDGSTDSTIELIEQFKTDMLNLQYVFQQNAGRAAARNTGAKNAHTEKLIFLDDDLLFDKNLIANYYSEIARGHSIIVGVAEPILTNGNNEFYSYASYLNERWSANEVLRKGIFLNAQNCFIEKGIFNDLGGFDERLRDSEDFDLGSLAVSQGFNIHQSSDLVVRHFIQRNFIEYANRLKEYHHSRKVLYSLKPDLEMEKKIKGGMLRTYLDSLFNGKIWIHLIDKGLFKIFPMRFRFRLYSFLLRAFSIK